MVFFFPIVLATGILLFPATSIWLWIGSLAIFTLIGIFEGYLLENDKKLLCILINLSASAFLSYAFLGISPKVILSSAIYIIILYLGIQSTKAPVVESLPHTASQGWLAIYLISYFIFIMVGVLKPYTPIITLMAVISTVVYLFQSNELKLKSMTNSTNKKLIPASIVKHNRLTIVFTFLSIFIISNVPVIKNVILAIWYMLSKTLTMIIDWLTRLGNIRFSKTDYSDDALSHSTGSFNPSILKVVLVVFAVLAFIVICKIIYEVTKDLRNSLFQGRNIKETDFGYEDEEVSLINLDNLKKGYNKKVRTRLSNLYHNEPKWKDLKSNKERIRYIYKHILLNSISAGYLFKAHLTPSETVKDLDDWKQQKLFEKSRLALLYNVVRYGDGDVEDADVEKVRESFADNKMLK